MSSNSTKLHYWGTLPTTIDAIEHWSKNGQITRKDTTKWFSSMIILGHFAKPIKETLTKMFYPPYYILQILFLPITTYFDRWLMACLSSASTLMKIPKMNRFVDNLERWNPPITRKMRKSSSFGQKRWTIFWINSNIDQFKIFVTIFHNKTVFLLKNPLKLMHISNMYVCMYVLGCPEISCRCWRKIETQI